MGIDRTIVPTYRQPSHAKRVTMHTLKLISRGEARQVRCSPKGHGGLEQLRSDDRLPKRSGIMQIQNPLAVDQVRLGNCRLRNGHSRRFLRPRFFRHTDGGCNGYLRHLQHGIDAILGFRRSRSNKLRSLPIRRHAPGPGDRDGWSRRTSDRRSPADRSRFIEDLYWLEFFIRIGLRRGRRSIGFGSLLDPVRNDADYGKDDDRSDCLPIRRRQYLSYFHVCRHDSLYTGLSPGRPF